MAENPLLVDTIVSQFGSRTYSQITLRDVFAAFAMQATISLPDCRLPVDIIAKDAYMYADAMLAERGKTEVDDGNDLGR